MTDFITPEDLDNSLRGRYSIKLTYLQHAIMTVGDRQVEIPAWFPGLGRVYNVTGNSPQYLHQWVSACTLQFEMSQMLNHMPVIEKLVQFTVTSRNSVANPITVREERPIPIPKFRTLLRRSTCRNR